MRAWMLIPVALLAVAAGGPKGQGGFPHYREAEIELRSTIESATIIDTDFWTPCSQAATELDDGCSWPFDVELIEWSLVHNDTTNQDGDMSFQVEVAGVLKSGWLMRFGASSSAQTDCTSENGSDSIINEPGDSCQFDYRDGVNSHAIVSIPAGDVLRLKHVNAAGQDISQISSYMRLRVVNPRDL